ncbi:MAG: ribosome-recycling factor, partial [Actinomycetota bacterium]
MIEETLLDAMEKMGKAVEHVQAQFLGVRTGRANASLVDKLQVEYFGAFVPLQQLASFQVPEARMLVVKPHDRGSIAAIERAIQSSDLGLSPSNDGVVIRLSFPALTEERRKDFVKVVKNMAEEG